MNRILRYFAVAACLLSTSAALSYEQIGDTTSMYSRAYFFDTVLPQWAGNANVQYILYMTSDLSTCPRCRGFNNDVLTTSTWKDYATANKIGVYEAGRGSRMPGDGRTSMPVVSLFRKPTDVSEASDTSWRNSFRKNYLVADIPLNYVKSSGRDQFMGYLTTLISNDKAMNGSVDVNPGSSSDSSPGIDFSGSEHGWNVLSISGEDSYTREGLNYVFGITRSGDAKDALTLLILVNGAYYADVRWKAGEFGTKQVSVEVPVTDEYDDGDNIVVSIKSQNRYIRLKQ